MDDRKVQRVAREVGESADAAFAENHAGVSFCEDVLGREQELLQRGRHAALQENGLPRLSGLLQELEVLHVAGADLEAVRVMRHDLDVRGVENLRDDGKKGGLSRRRENLQAFLSEALKGVRRRARLVGAAAQQVRAARLHFLRDRERLLERLDRAGAGDDDDARAAHQNAPHRHDRVFGMEFARHELVGMRDAENLEDARKRLEGTGPDGPLVPRNSDRRALGAGNRVGLEPKALGRRDDPFDVRARGAPVHDDQHDSACSFRRRLYFIPPPLPHRRLPEVPMSTVSRTLLLPAAALALAVFSAMPADATYVIYTRDGARIEAREKPVVQGRRVVYLTPLGTSQTISLIHISEPTRLGMISY